MAVFLNTAEGHWDEAVVNGVQKSMEKLCFYLRGMNPTQATDSHVQAEALQSENEKEETSEGNKCQGSHFLIGLFLAAGDSGSVTTCWSFEGGFLQNGNVLTRTISLAVLSPVGNSYPMTSSSKLDGIYIYS